MEDNDGMKESNQEEQEQDSDATTKFLIFVTILFLIVVAWKYLLPALQPGNHAPTSVIEDVNSGGYFDEVFGDY